MNLRKVSEIMSYCTKCKSEISQDAQFCPRCGAPVQIETTTPPPTSPPPTPTPSKPISSNLFDRMIRAARLDASLYEEVERDETATTQALIVVIISSFCAGIGTAIGQFLCRYRHSHR
jgi:predicted amidophosphoribosyltransferase